MLEARRGVCQDFAHLATGCLRSLGLAARYVSGYIETDPPPGRKRLIGADASHAWCSIWVPQQGWIDFDPTNDRLPTHRHVTVAWGRDYGDVAPVRGVVIGPAADQTLVRRGRRRARADAPEAGTERESRPRMAANPCGEPGAGGSPWRGSCDFRRRGRGGRTKRGATLQHVGRVPPRLITKPFVAVTAATGAFFIYVGMLVPLLPTFIEDELGAGELGVGLSISAFAFAAIFARPLIGRLVERFGRRRVMIAGSLLAGLAGFLCATVNSLPPLLAAARHRRHR